MKDAAFDTDFAAETFDSFGKPVLPNENMESAPDAEAMDVTVAEAAGTMVEGGQKIDAIEANTETRDWDWSDMDSIVLGDAAKTAVTGLVFLPKTRDAISENMGNTTTVPPVFSFTSATPVSDDGAYGDLTLLVPSDALYGNQWHLNQPSGVLFDLGDLQTIWDEYSGAGVEVAIIDDGVQRSHEDLDDNYSSVKDWDFFDNDTDPTGVNGNNHGTAVAGIIGANLNNIGVVGVAHGSTIFGFRVQTSGSLPSLYDLFLDQINDAIENASGEIQTAGVNREADIVNMSLGTQLGTNQFDTELPTPSLMNDLDSSIDFAAANGRGGLGTIMVKSAGNGRSSNHDAQASEWNANEHTISVAAVDQSGFVSSYSTHGNNILISGFGTPGQVWTTDRMGSEGYVSGGATPNYTGGFNGTSAAAPMVSGVIALMLEANSSLGWRDVQEILAYSARHVGTAIGSGTSGSEEYAWSFNGASNWNGGGLHHSNDYGFGLVDAFAAVRLAETWQTSHTSANDSTEFEDILNTTQTLTGGNAANDFAITFTSGIRIEFIEIDINFTEWYDLGDLDIELIAPDGTVAHIIDNIGENDGSSAGGFTGRWEFMTPQFMGMTATGNWTLRMRDSDSNTVSPITINDIDITVRGAGGSETENATFIFTNEFSDYAGSTHSTSAFAGGSTGVDTMNAAAVTSNSTVDLLNNSGNIDGVAITGVSHIERVYTGDGQDTIIGDSFGNYLDAGRGNDSVSGGSAGESIYGRAGNDILDGGGGTNFVYGGDGNDTMIGGNIGDDNMYGQDGNDTFRYISGVAGNAQEYAQGGNGSDKIQLFDTGTYDFTAGGTITGFNVFSIEEIEFFANGNNQDKEIILSDKEFQGGFAFATDLLIDGNASGGSDDTIRIIMNHGNVMDMSMWQFQDWFGASEMDDNVDRIIVEGSSGNDTITGSSKDDEIDGGAGVDSIMGGDGSDILRGGAGSGDIINGGLGNDIMFQVNGEGSDLFDGGSGSDTLDWSGMTIGTFFDFNADTYAYSLGGTARDFKNIEHVIGGSGSDTFIATFLGNGTSIDGGAGVDHLDLSSNAANISVNQRVFDIDNGYSFNGGAFQSMWSNLENLTIFANVAGTVLGNSVNNVLTGSSYDDILNGNAGRDTLMGLAGADLFILDSNEGYDDIDGGTGVDTVDITALNGIVFDLAGETYGVAGSAFVFDLKSIANVTSRLANGDDVFIGSGTANVINAGGGNDRFDNVGGGDTFNGELGNDTVTFVSGWGTDTLDGGAGIDVLDFSGIAAGTGVIGIDLDGGYSFNGGGQSGTWSNFENVIGSVRDDNIVGNDLNNDLRSGDGNDTINGGDGNDTIYGESGNDRLLGGEGDDFIAGGSNGDTIRGGLGDDTIIGGGGADQVLYTGLSSGVFVSLESGISGGAGGSDSLSNIENVFGSGHADIIYGSNAKGNRLEGSNGDDKLYGLDGRDTLLGGNDNDSLYGGDDVDRLLGQSGNDRLDGGAATDFLTGGSGADTFILSDIAHTGVGRFNRDEVRDFSTADGDVMNVFLVDADSTVGGNQAFTFAGTSFTGTAGELILNNYTFSGVDVTIASMDVDGDGNADGQIYMVGSGITIADFVL
ncbi:S8 family serine peptidase [Tateyamaria sp. SN3-11]|uniref:S8 family serine peptidase n=1 Tax=Tateyamaria sp. SN3-11 TaxID=3092147 RepID=UPI0039EA2D06